MLGYTFTYRNSVKSKSETVTSKRFVRLKNEKKKSRKSTIRQKTQKGSLSSFCVAHLLLDLSSTQNRYFINFKV